MKCKVCLLYSCHNKHTLFKLEKGNNNVHCTTNNNNNIYVLSTKSVYEIKHYGSGAVQPALPFTRCTVLILYYTKQDDKRTLAM